MDEMLKSITNGIAIFSIVQFGILKVVYTVLLIIQTSKIKKSLCQSNALRNGTDNLHGMSLFIVVCIIPTVNNAVYLCSDLPQIVFTYIERNTKNGCDETLVNFSLRVQMPLIAVSYFFGSLLQCITYIIIFPKVRRD